MQWLSFYNREWLDTTTALLNAPIQKKYTRRMQDKHLNDAPYQAAPLHQELSAIAVRNHTVCCPQVYMVLDCSPSLYPFVSVPTLYPGVNLLVD